MSRSVSWLDRLRVERVVWTLDQQLYDLPRADRIAIRREVRQNILAAARDVGTSAALRNLGSTSALADGYLAAEFGHGPRYSWIAALLFAASFPLVLFAVLADAAHGFGAGLLAADPHATGTFTWPGLSFLQQQVTYSLVDGQGSYAGGAPSVGAWAVLVVGTVLCGRLWRIPSVRRRRRAVRAAA
jgi:hypothetical protein